MRNFADVTQNTLIIMAKKKKTNVVQMIPKNKVTGPTTQELEDFGNFMRILDEMPQEARDNLLLFLKDLENIPEDEREMALTNMLSGMLAEMCETLGDECADDDEDDILDEDDRKLLEGKWARYPHFKKRKGVKKYTLRVTLKNFKPAIYRKFIVPSNISLRHLSELLLELMGWMDEHMNQFRVHGDYYSPAYQRDGENDFLFFDPTINHNQENFALQDVLKDKGKSIMWEYDFGDSWEHKVKLSSVADYKDGEPHLVEWVKGAGACPPEDCGGVWGYADLLQLREMMLKGEYLDDEELERLEWYDLAEPDLDLTDCEEDYRREVCQDFCK